MGPRAGSLQQVGLLNIHTSYSARCRCSGIRGLIADRIVRKESAPRTECTEVLARRRGVCYSASRRIRRTSACPRRERQQRVDSGVRRPLQRPSRFVHSWALQVVRGADVAPSTWYDVPRNFVRRKGLALLYIRWNNTSVPRSVRSRESHCFPRRRVVRQLLWRRCSSTFR